MIYILLSFFVFVIQHWICCPPLLVASAPFGLFPGPYCFGVLDSFYAPPAPPLGLSPGRAPGGGVGGGTPAFHECPLLTAATAATPQSPLPPGRPGDRWAPPEDRKAHRLGAGSPMPPDSISFANFPPFSLAPFYLPNSPLRGLAIANFPEPAGRPIGVVGHRAP